MKGTLAWLVTLVGTHPRTISLLVALGVLAVDVLAGAEIQFPLIYVIPVGMASWWNRQHLAYGLAVVLPLMRTGLEFPWGADVSLSIAAINGLEEIAAMLLYAYLVRRSAEHAERLQDRVISREAEVGRLRAFAKLTSATLQGRGISPGMVEGVVWLHLATKGELTAARTPISRHEVEGEIARLETALVAMIEQLRRTEREGVGAMGATERELLEVQLAMLKDAQLWQACKQRVRDELISADSAVGAEIRHLAEMLEATQNEVLRERGADIRDVGRGVLGALRAPGETVLSPLAALPPDTILVAEELLPSDLLHMDRTNVVGLVTERNSPASHVAILARSRNLPAVSDIRDVAAFLETGDRLLVDADAGTVIVAPTRMQSELFAERYIRHARHGGALAEDRGQEALTKDGVRIGLYANLSRPDEAQLVSEYRLDGIGLFRSELLFLDVAEPPTLEAQEAIYSAVARAIGPAPVVIRTMDFGGDKLPRFNSIETAAALRTGKRGLAFSLTEKTLFNTQIKAILRAGEQGEVGEVRILFPMVTGVADLREARRMVAQVMEAERITRHVSIGAMIETPAAVIKIRELVKMLDFLSIGTNDLTHFILGTDRHEQGVAGVAAFLHPSVLRATDHVVRSAVNAEIDLSVCGEAAADPVCAGLLVGMGVRNLSVNPFQAPRIRSFLAQVTLEQLEAIALECLAAETPEELQKVATSKMLPMSVG